MVNVNWFRAAWLAWVITGFVIEITAILVHTEGATLSEIVWYISLRYPLLPLMLGLLMGHFFWQSVSSGSVKFTK